jgi:hypothetical protein
VIAYTDQFPPVIIVVPSSTLARFVVFELSIEALLVPSGSHLSRGMSANIALNCNEAVRLYPQGRFYWFIDDDHQFDQYTLLRLMAHDLPVVVPVTCLKDPPFYPVLFKEERPDAQTGYPMFIPYSWADLDGKTGLLDVYACGRSGMLVRRDVFDQMPWPWFELGKNSPEYAGEDMWFCKKLRDLGIPVKADLDLTFGHIAPVSAWPTRQADGRLLVRLVWANGQAIMLNRPGAPPVRVPERDQRGNRVAERMATLMASAGLGEQAAFEQALREVEAEEATR